MTEPEHVQRPRVGQTLAQAALLLAFLTLVSRVVGLLRVRIFTSHFGAGEVLDTYYAAFRIPDFFNGVIYSGYLVGGSVAGCGRIFGAQTRPGPSDGFKFN
jgi:hypothetical protein